MAKNKQTKSQQPEQRPAEEEAESAGGGVRESTDASQPMENKQTTKPAEPAPEDFESFYLKQVTAEFADDLDRLRNANDFSEKSVPILIETLKQTAKVYSEEEKRKVMGNLEISSS